MIALTVWLIMKTTWKRPIYSNLLFTQVPSENDNPVRVAFQWITDHVILQGYNECLKFITSPRGVYFSQWFLLSSAVLLHPIPGTRKPHSSWQHWARRGLLIMSGALIYNVQSLTLREKSNSCNSRQPALITTMWQPAIQRTLTQLSPVASTYSEGNPVYFATEFSLDQFLANIAFCTPKVGLSQTEHIAEVCMYLILEWCGWNSAQLGLSPTRTQQPHSWAHLSPKYALQSTSTFSTIS